VGGNVEAANIVQKVTPIYPAEAKANRVQGSVRFTVVIGKDGRVQNVTLVSGDPVLAQAAKEAVQQWVYKPTLLNGDPVEVMTQVDVNFTLSQ
jgi:protein TonB